MRAALLPLALLSLLAGAQSWCPPGATWSFTYQSWMTDGYVMRTYVGDTLVDGWVAQRIHQLGELILYPNNDTITVDNVVLTSVQDSVLYTRVNWNGGSAWDTLYHFNAGIGDRWFPPGADSVCMNGTEGMLEVIDTSTVMIDGLPLRQWSIAYIDANGEPIWDAFHVTERLGILFGFTLVPGVCIIVEYGEILRCYSDFEIEYYAPGWAADCDLVTSAQEQNIGDGLVYPNPGTSSLTLTLIPGPHTITLFDATGRMVLQQRTTDARPVITTEALPAGLYRITVRTEQGGVMGATWVKE